MNAIDEQKLTAYAHWEASKPYVHERILNPKPNVSYHAHNCPTGFMWALAIEAVLILGTWAAIYFWGK